MRIARPRGSHLLSAFLIFVFGLWLGWQANSFTAQDICLDRGGAWNEDTRSCRYMNLENQ